MTTKFKKATKSLLDRNLPVIINGCRLSKFDCSSDILVTYPDMGKVIAVDLEDALRLVAAFCRIV